MYFEKAFEACPNEKEFLKLFRNLCLKHHPDVDGDPDTFKRMFQAFERVKARKVWPADPKVDSKKSKTEQHEQTKPEFSWSDFGWPSHNPRAYSDFEIDVLESMHLPGYFTMVLKQVTAESWRHEKYRFAFFMYSCMNDDDDLNEAFPADEQRDFFNMLFDAQKKVEIDRRVFTVIDPAFMATMTLLDQARWDYLSNEVDQEMSFDIPSCDDEIDQMRGYANPFPKRQGMIFRKIEEAEYYLELILKCRIRPTKKKTAIAETT